ncbi:hypothetical protein ACT7CX_29315 [Bacillus cereus]
MKAQYNRLAELVASKDLELTIEVPPIAWWYVPTSLMPNRKKKLIVGMRN